MTVEVTDSDLIDAAAKIKDELAKARQDGYEEGISHCSAKDAEIAKLRAERDEWRDKSHSLNSDRAAARDAVFKEGLARIEAEKQLAAARAALDGEREACDAARKCVVVHDGRETGTDATACARWRREHDERRAAEAKASRGGETQGEPK